MLSAAALRRWSLVHRWSSLACAPVLLILCLTGLPLVFHDEIDRALGYAVAAQDAAGQGATRPLSVRAIVAEVLARHPGRHVQFVLWDPDTPGVVSLALGRAADSPPAENQAVYVEAASGAILAEGALHPGPVGVLLKLHGQLFLGAAGALPLGLVAMLLLTALVSGIVVYAPYARSQPFGTLRAAPRRARWLDLHQLAGVVIAGWLLIVGATGLINSWGDLAVELWQVRELSHLSIRSTAVLGPPAPLEAVLSAARAEAPGMTPYFIAMPGSALTSREDYGVFLRGDTSLTRYLLEPVLVDRSAHVVASGHLPGYMQALFLAQPLHFGDYGGGPLKALWALFDLTTLLVLATGLAHWLGRRRATGAPRITQGLR